MIHINFAYKLLIMAIGLTASSLLSMDFKKDTTQDNLLNEFKIFNLKVVEFVQTHGQDVDDSKSYTSEQADVSLVLKPKNEQEYSIEFIIPLTINQNPCTDLDKLITQFLSIRELYCLHWQKFVNLLDIFEIKSTPRRGQNFCIIGSLTVPNSKIQEMQHEHNFKTTMNLSNNMLRSLENDITIFNRNVAKFLQMYGQDVGGSKSYISEKHKISLVLKQKNEQEYFIEFFIPLTANSNSITEPDKLITQFLSIRKQYYENWQTLPSILNLFEIQGHKNACMHGLLTIPKSIFKKEQDLYTINALVTHVAQLLQMYGKPLPLYSDNQYQLHSYSTPDNEISLLPAENENHIVNVKFIVPQQEMIHNNCRHNTPIESINLLIKRLNAMYRINQEDATIYHGQFNAELKGISSLQSLHGSFNIENPAMFFTGSTNSPQRQRSASIIQSEGDLPPRDRSRSLSKKISQLFLNQNKK